MHLTWKMRVRSAVNGFSDWSEVHANAPEKSDIGRWIQDVGLWKYQHEPVFEMFLKQHQLLHDVAYKIQTLSLSGRHDDARAMLSELDKLSDDFLKLIDTYKTVLESYKDQLKEQKSS
jgi:hypothetical protein